jgi:hypothetical protein
MEDTHKKGTPIEATVEVERFGRGRNRYEARPARMSVGGKPVSFQVEDFITYGWTRRGAQRQCVRKVISYLKMRAKKLEK